MGRSQDDSFAGFGDASSPFLHPRSPTFGNTDAEGLEHTFVRAARLLRGRLLSLSDDLAHGDITVQDYVVRARASIRTAFFTAYSVGALSVFPFYTLTDRDVRILDDELAEETGFLKAFARDISADRLSLDPRTRSGLYLLALRGIFERGRVEAMPPGPYRWRLGITEHCIECFQAADQGPYQRDRYSGLGLPPLPGTPGDGTVCLGLTRCGCTTVLVNGVIPNQELADRIRSLLLEVAHGANPVAAGT